MGRGGSAGRSVRPRDHTVHRGPCRPRPVPRVLRRRGWSGGGRQSTGRSRHVDLRDDRGGGGGGRGGSQRQHTAAWVVDTGSETHRKSTTFCAALARSDGPVLHNMPTWVPPSAVQGRGQREARSTVLRSKASYPFEAEQLCTATQVQGLSTLLWIVRDTVNRRRSVVFNKGNKMLHDSGDADARIKESQP